MKALKWSKYNLLFKSKANGYLLYNSITNSFAEIDRETYKELELIRQNPSAYDFGGCLPLYTQLLKIKALVHDREEEEMINVLRYKRLSQRYNASGLGLTIAPTLACNFNCSYCYEENRGPVHMKDKTEDEIIKFIGHFGDIKYLSVTWFGGEPLLQFDRICGLTEKFKKLNITYGATMVTNGYLLSDEVIGKLDDLKIKSIQVTIDGPEKIHDERRALFSGGRTFQKIISNIEKLLRIWSGKLSVRVNVDKSNNDAYHECHEFLTRKFKGKNLKIYAGIVSGAPGVNPDTSCNFNKDDAADFTIEQYRKHNIDDLPSYPTANPLGCVATSDKGYVIGPRGEIYKCWHDVGLREREVGTIFDGEPWNMKLLANYMVGTDAFDDPKCISCFLIPVCDGGCAELRMKNNSGNFNFDTCLEYKNRLPELLEIFYEKNKKKSIENKSIEKEAAPV